MILKLASAAIVVVNAARDGCAQGRQTPRRYICPWQPSTYLAVLVVGGHAVARTAEPKSSLVLLDLISAEELGCHWVVREGTAHGASSLAASILYANGSNMWFVEVELAMRE